MSTSNHDLDILESDLRDRLARIEGLLANLNFSELYDRLARIETKVEENGKAGISEPCRKHVEELKSFDDRLRKIENIISNLTGKVLGFAAAGSLIATLLLKLSGV